MLGFLLIFLSCSCKKNLKIAKVMITCGANNLASEKTILVNGGVFEKNVEMDGCIIKRYWITLE